MIKWTVFIISNLIFYPCFRNIWHDIDKANEEQKIKQEKKEQQCRGLMRECIMVDFNEEELKMMELIAYKNNWTDLKQKQILRKIIMKGVGKIR